MSPSITKLREIFSCGRLPGQLLGSRLPPVGLLVFPRARVLVGAAAVGGERERDQRSDVVMLKSEEVLKNIMCVDGQNE